MKQCSKCKQFKDLNCFSKDKHKRSGYVSQCKECKNSYDKEYKNKNRAEINRKRVDYYYNNLEYVRDYYVSNKEKINKQAKEYYKNNTHIFRARDAKRRALQLKATPKWLSKEQIAQIKIEYALAEWCTKVTNEKYEVDHIVPLQGKNVSGLHVPWNLQVITKVDNRKKANKHAE
jgi:hypothetical protein